MMITKTNTGIERRAYAQRPGIALQVGKYSSVCPQPLPIKII